LTRFAVAVCVTVGLPPLPVTVNLNVPFATEAGTEMLNVDEFVAGFGLKLDAQPAGRPVREKLTGALNAPLLLTVIV
jgi:hypothetical protein